MTFIIQSFGKTGIFRLEILILHSSRSIQNINILNLLTESVYSATICMNRFGLFINEVKSLDKFFNLPSEKQNSILDAALSVFGINGYKKTSVSDIAAAAGISKAMVFHYFGTKKALYLYLIELCGHILMDEVNKNFENNTTDFFDRIMLATDIEISVMKKHPTIPLFINSIYFEKDAEVKDDIQALFTSENGEVFRNRIACEGMDTSKFKDGVDPELVMKMLLYFTYGYINMSPGIAQMDLDALYKDFKDCVTLLKNNFYKEEYLG